MNIVRSFRELRVYMTARQACADIFHMTRKFPKEERYSLTDQIRRASRATKALIGEAWGRRRFRDSFAHKLVEALGEANEVQSWIDDAEDCAYVDPSWANDMRDRWEVIASSISRMIDRADLFCPNSPKTDYSNTIQEDSPESEWFIDS